MSILVLFPPNVVIKPLTRVFDHSGIKYETCTDRERCLYLSKNKLYRVILVIHTESLSNLLNFYSDWKKVNSMAAFVVLSRKQSALERVNALKAGVTAYHITPFSYSQLVMDLAQHEYFGKLPEQSVIAHGICLNYISQTITYKGKFLYLTRKQYELLSLFLRYPGQVFSRVQIWESIWDTTDYTLANTIDVHVNRLRKALPAGARELIETIYGFGYRLRPQQDSE